MKDAITVIDEAIQEAIASIGRTTTLEEINKIGITKKEVIKYEFKEEKIQIVPLTDPHFGHKASNVEMLGAMVKYILQTENCYTVLLGDLMEVATKTSIGTGAYSQAIHFGAQIKLIYKLLKPLADAGKILGGVTGNHEMRAMYSLALNPMSELCDKLQVPYLGFQGYLLLNVNKHIHTVMLYHGKGGGSTPAGKLNAMYKASKVANVDLYLTGHTHTKMYDREQYYTIDKETGELITKTRHYATCGSMLNYWDNYSEMSLLPPEELGLISIELSDVIKVTV